MPGPPLVVTNTRSKVLRAAMIVIVVATVNSGLRLVKRAAQAEKPVVIVNLGSTRADELANVRINGSTSELLGAIFG